MAAQALGLHLERAERRKLEERRRDEKDARIGYRLSALLWLADGRPTDEVAALLGRSSRTIRNWAKLYKKKGLVGLTTLNYKGDEGDLSTAQQQRLKEEVATGRFRCAAQAQAFLSDSFGKSFSLSGTRKLLARLGCTFHRASSFLFKAKRDKQEEFVKDYEQERTMSASNSHP